MLGEGRNYYGNCVQLMQCVLTNTYLTLQALHSLSEAASPTNQDKVVYHSGAVVTSTPLLPLFPLPPCASGYVRVQSLLPHPLPTSPLAED